MKKSFLLIKIIVLYLLLVLPVHSAKQDFFDQGKILFDLKEFDKSKFFFEKDIVFNPKSEKSYLYLAKISKQSENDIQEEMNLNNVLLLNPKNEEAIYLLILLKIKQSDYNEANTLIKKFDLFCKSFCEKKDEIEKKFSKLSP